LLRRYLHAVAVPARCWIWTLDRHGELSPYVFLVLILLTMVAERILLWRIFRGCPRRSAACCMNFAKRPLRQGWGYPQLRAVVLRLRSLSQYVLNYRRPGFSTHPLEGRHALQQGDLRAIDRATNRENCHLPNCREAIMKSCLSLLAALLVMVLLAAGGYLLGLSERYRPLEPGLPHVPPGRRRGPPEPAHATPELFDKYLPYAVALDMGATVFRGA
jgi:hypothetical protein